MARASELAIVAGHDDDAAAACARRGLAFRRTCHPPRARPDPGKHPVTTAPRPQEHFLALLDNKESAARTETCRHAWNASSAGRGADTPRRRTSGGCGRGTDR